MKVLSLFTGAGGFDLGLEAAGFEVAGTVEVDHDARDTLRLNRPTWPCIDPGDIHVHEPNDLLGAFELERREVSVLAAGPPCQPFSKSGFWATGTTRRLNDPRATTLQAIIDVASAALPHVMLIENVTGISTNAHGDAIELIETGLHQINRATGTSYRLQLLTIDAASYGVPQRRERAFLFAHRDGGSLELPTPTHTADLETQELDAHRFATAWDAIGHLDFECVDQALRVRGKWADLLPTIPEGRNYLWHTDRGGGEPLFGWRTRYWTFLLKLAKARPSWTLQAAPGPSTGPFHWRNRLLSIEEMCRLQTFPSGYKVSGSYSSARRQIGNAVPAAIGELLGRSIRSLIHAERFPERLSLTPILRDDCPPPQDPAPVPRRFYVLRGQHDPHPGVGRGPRGTGSLEARHGKEA